MKEKYNFSIDTHMHTIMSGHAYNTLDEMISYAKQKNMELICITEHGPKMPGSCHEYYFSNYLALKKNTAFLDYIRPTKVLFGIEVNILDKNGNIDLDMTDPINRNCMDIVIASIHNCTYQETEQKLATNAIINAIKNPEIDIIGHPDDRDLNYQEIVYAAKEYNKILELNNSSNNPNGFRKGARERDLIMLELCKKYGVMIALGSDAHCKYDIGNFKYIIPLLKEVDFPINLILNSNSKNFNKFINRRK